MNRKTILIAGAGTIATCGPVFNQIDRLIIAAAKSLTGCEKIDLYNKLSDKYDQVRIVTETTAIQIFGGSAGAGRSLEHFIKDSVVFAVKDRYPEINVDKMRASFSGLDALRLTPEPIIFDEAKYLFEVRERTQDRRPWYVQAGERNKRKRKY